MSEFFNTLLANDVLIDSMWETIKSISPFLVIVFGVAFGISEIRYHLTMREITRESNGYY